MTVYVDDWRQPARFGRHDKIWSHLTVGPGDDIAELHDFAARIGLKRSWFQDLPWPREHYDVTDNKRRQALAQGAVAIPWREAAQQRRQAIERHRRAGQAVAQEQAPECPPGLPPGRAPARQGLAAQTAGRLTAAGISPNHPALTAIKRWNAAAYDRAAQAVAARNEPEAEAG